MKLGLFRVVWLYTESPLNHICVFKIFFLKSVLIYLRESVRVCEREQREREGMEGEGKANSLLSREPDVVLNPRTPRA